MLMFAKDAPVGYVIQLIDFADRTNWIVLNKGIPTLPKGIRYIKLASLETTIKGNQGNHIRQALEIPDTKLIELVSVQRVII